MSVSHLTDRQLQSFVEDTLTDDKAEIIKHLRLCKRCQTQVRGYMLVRSAMAEEPPADFFSVDFDEALMARIVPAGKRRFIVRDYLVAAFILAAVVIQLGYFFIDEQMRILIGDSYHESWTIIKEAAIGLFCLDGMGISCLMLPTIVLVMFLACIMLDRIYIQPRIRLVADD